MERITRLYPSGNWGLKGGIDDAVKRLAAYEDTDLEPQLVRLLADAICGKTGVFCSKCGDGLCLAAGKDGLEIGCFGCGEYVPVKELFEVYREMKRRNEHGTDYER